jgi:acyl carrier protein
MENELTTLIATEILDTDQALTPQSDLFAAGLDSMGIMQLLLAIEDRFGVAIDPADLSRDNFSTAEKRKRRHPAECRRPSKPSHRSPRRAATASFSGLRA